MALGDGHSTLLAGSDKQVHLLSVAIARIMYFMRVYIFVWGHVDVGGLIPVSPSVSLYQFQLDRLSREPRNLPVRISPPSTPIYISSGVHTRVPMLAQQAPH